MSRSPPFLVEFLANIGNLVCVEAGSVADWQTLESQNIWEGGVLIGI